MATSEPDKATQLLATIKERTMAGLNASFRSRTRCLADALEPIEAALAFGIYRSAIVQALNEAGMTIDVDSFATSLHRLRQRARNDGKPSASTSPGSGMVADVGHGTPAATSQPYAGQQATHKSREQIAAENPMLSRADVRRLYADQFVSRPSSGDSFLQQLHQTD